MGLNVTSYTGNGLRDWVMQRITAIILVAYTITLCVFFARHMSVSYQEWRDLFDSVAMQIFTLLAILSLMIHAWIGIWTVTTDYIKCAGIRITVQILIRLALFIMLVWGILILWGG